LLGSRDEESGRALPSALQTHRLWAGGYDGGGVCHAGSLNGLGRIGRAQQGALTVMRGGSQAVTLRAAIVPLTIATAVAPI